MSKELRSGYTTGTHATAVLGAVLVEFYKSEKILSLDVSLPKVDASVKIDVTRESKWHFSTIKVDNDDLDVTKGCCIHAELFLSTPVDLKAQKPSQIELGETKLLIYGGNGVGIVTKAGLKISPEYPAINPVPLEMMKDIASSLVDKDETRVLHLVISVDDGMRIAKDTANEKVGVIGGISILGTRGIVKPISADAYLDSIDAEISVIEASASKEVILTLGNSAHDYSNKNYDKNIVVEIGNFIYDASLRLKGRKFKKMVFVASVAKMCKIAQECKNTHNRFGGIDFDEVKLWLIKELKIDLTSDEYLTLKAVLQKLPEKETKLFTTFLGYKAAQSFKKWFIELDIEINEIEIITLNGDDVNNKELRW
ncbi:cobalt-precorrin-5B (C(1))-methyltransferase CbiD [Sulfurimonas sp.]|uniref:cobalt-precorrin-5B (C(1))-methyltransferase CbiD n=1 Tax=Sulfurimonas sp. TaxID=2022749 RepID=UPI0025E84623|nr:cobalt-precorrin-5B (C(1))-methyltransferase CbiD [Sulfurimonas sp.]